MLSFREEINSKLNAINAAIGQLFDKDEQNLNLRRFLNSLMSEINNTTDDFVGAKVFFLRLGQIMGEHQ